MEIVQPIFLIGFMGVGKTTLGKKLANALKLPFIDSDMALEQEFQLSINEYFEEFGEDQFRAKEQQWIQQLIKQPAIISTGGGLPCFFDNLNEMKKKGLVIYLERPTKEIIQRLKQGKNKRPLIASKSDEELLFFVTELLNERIPHYERAHITATREQQTADGIIDLIQDYIN